MPANGKFVLPNMLSETFIQNDIFLGKLGNKDQFQKIRIPKKGEIRSNIHVGGDCEKVELSINDKKICKRISGYLKSEGLFFVGIDIIGNYLTEINLTSPTGMQELERFDQINVAAMVWTAIEDRFC